MATTEETYDTPVKLSRRDRTELIREGHRFNREEGDGLMESFEIGDHIAGYMFEREEKFNLMGFPAIAISDYAYGVAYFVCGRRDI